MSNNSKITLAFLLVFIGLQFFNPKKESRSFPPGNDLLSIYSPPEEITDLIKTACYDCHSEVTDWPWYAHIFPVSTWVQGHVQHGKEELNFSNWKPYTSPERAEILDHIIHIVKKGGMPLNSYTWIHEEAIWSEKEKEMVFSFLKECIQQEQP